MSFIPQVNSNTTYASYVSQLDTEVATLKAELKSGLKTLTAADQGVMTTLSAKLPGLTTTTQTISKAVDTIAVAQTGLATMKNTLAQMQSIAMQAAGGNNSGVDNYFLDRSFQTLLGQVTETALKASLNNTNLLTGSAGLWVQTGVENIPVNRFKINSVDIYSVMTMGVMSGVTVDTPAHAQLAMQRLSQSITTVTNGQQQLGSTKTQLNGKASGVTDTSTKTQQDIANMQKINEAQLRQQLSVLQSMQSAYSDMASQMGPMASTELMMLA